MQNSNDNNFNDIGKQIVNSLSHGLNTGDYSDLKSAIKRTASDAIKEAAGGFTFDYSKGGPQGYVNPQGRPNSSKAYAAELEAKRREREARRAREAKEREQQSKAMTNQTVASVPKAGKPTLKISNLPTKFVPVGKVSSILLAVFGGIGVVISSIACIASGFNALFLGGSFTGTIVAAFLALVSGIVFKIGMGQRADLIRAKRYVQICGQNMYSQLPALASALGIKVSQVKKDVKRMLRKGYFPEGYIDAEETTLMLSTDVFKQYQRTREYSLNATAGQTSNDLGTVISSESISLSEKATKARERLSKEQRAELDAMVKEGYECIDRLHRLNDEIPGQSISDKMDELERTLKEIFLRVSENPEQMGRMHKLMDYYLPTMLKLVEAYKEYDRVASPGHDIVNAMQEIENTLDTINDAFSQLLNNLFRDSVWDVTTDAQVLQTMLKQEGLTE